MRAWTKALVAGGLAAFCLAGPASAGSPYAEAQSALADGDLVTAARLFREAADQGDADAQNSLGELYENGRGVPKPDLDQAIHWYRAAADQGQAAAENHLGVMYALGKGVPKDSVQSYVWFDLAVAHAQAGSGEAPNYLRNRDRIAAGLKADQIAEAQKRVHDWVSK